MDRNLARFKAILKESSHTVTKSRFSLFRSLIGSPPLTMNELSKILQKQMDRVTVYRNVELFEELGIIQRLHIGWKYKLELSDAFNEHHHHLSCTSCGITTDVQELPSLERFIKEIAISKDFEISSHELEIRGLCQACQN